MRNALILVAIYPQIGGVLIRGERGTAKSTAARGLAALLPPIQVIKGCRFGCDPDRPGSWCTECKERYQQGCLVPTQMRSTPFVNLPISATEDRVVGTLDIEAAIQKGVRRFEPGILASANRGLLYIDEVNLLDDHVVDVLLDAAAMGVNIVEREGISFSHPARFILVGTMNPEEGDLRPQLTDRFGLSVEIRGIHDPLQRVTILERSLEFEDNPAKFCELWQAAEKELSMQIDHARNLVDQTTFTKDDLYTIARLTAEYAIEGHRADLVILKAARAQAAFAGRIAITENDILRAAELALPHRLRRTPFQPERILDREKLGELLKGSFSPVMEQPTVTDEVLDEKAIREKYSDPNNPWKDFVYMGHKQKS